MIRISNLLVATDFSAPSEAALQYGRELARTFNSTLQVLHVAECVSMIYGGENYTVTSPELQHEVEEAVQRQVEDLLTEDDRTSLHAKAVIVTAVSKPEAIVSYARTHAIDFIVMGTHGRGAISHLFMGSVAEHVVRTATCPVLTVHQTERESIAPDGRPAAAVRQHDPRSAAFTHPKMSGAPDPTAAARATGRRE